MALQVRRGTNAQRLLITPLPGELIYTTDTKNVYVGDGITLGGILVSGSGGGILNEDVQDICGPMFTGGTHTGISFTYDDETGTVNAVVTDEIGLTEIVSDTTPQLGGNLDLNGFDIFGDGNFITEGYFQGDLQGSVIGEGSELLINGTTGEITGKVTGEIDTTVPFRIDTRNTSLPSGTIISQSGEIGVRFASGVGAGGKTPNLLFSAFNGDFDNPTKVVANDFIGRIAFGGLITTPGNEAEIGLAFVQSRLTQESDGISTIPQAEILLSITNGPDPILNSISATFDSSGTFDAPIIKPGVYADGTARDAFVTSPEPGMIIYNTALCKFQGYVDDVGIAGGGPPTTTPGWVDLN